VAEADPSVGLVSSLNTYGPDVFWEPIPPDPPADPVTLDDLVLRSRFGSCGVLARRTCFETVGYFDETLRSVEDRDMWIRIAARYRVVCVRAALWWYQATPGSMSRNPERMEKFEYLVLERAFRMPELAGRRLLRRKAMGLASLASAWAFFDAGRPGTAIRRLVRSLAWWPVPYRQPDVRGSWPRARLLVAAIRGVLRRGPAVSG
jgi:hypothetical protein